MTTTTCPTQGESQLPPASPECSPRSASWSDPGSFQINAFVLSLEACEILHVPFKRGILFSTDLQLSHTRVLLAFKARCSGGSSSLGKTLRLGSPVQSSDPHYWGEPLQLWLFSCLWAAYPGVWVLTILHLCSTYPSCDSFFISLALENLFYQSLSHSHEQLLCVQL